MKRGKKAAEGSTAEEKAESRKMEKGEGPEYGDAPHGKMGKKPCAACAKKGKKKGSCGCGKGGKMDAALTPMEYLDACDLGIQNRSRAYVRGVLSVREDKKCGGSGIAEGKKCNKGMAGGAQSPGDGKLGTRGKIGAAMSIAGNIAGAAGVYGGIRSIGRGNLEQAHRRLAAANGATAIAATGNIMMAKDRGNKTMEKFNSGLLAATGAAAAGNYALSRKARGERLGESVRRVKSARDMVSSRLAAKKERMKYAKENSPNDPFNTMKTEMNAVNASSAAQAGRTVISSKIRELKAEAPMSAARRRKANNGGK
jgi:hypothetical protein